jgi:hypothetical protein
MARLAERLADELRGLKVVVSQKDRDPFGIA